MIHLKTTFAGLQLKNPIIISSSGLTNNAQKNKKLEEAGAAAVVLKSLFEEQITLQAEQMYDTVYYPEGNDYLQEYIRSNNLAQHLKLVEETKQVCNIPVIASINCYSESNWVDFAHKIELAGADAIELNILAVQTSCDYKYGEFEQRHINILREVKKHINIPIIVKLGSNLTNPIALVNQLYANGAAGVVMFNRFYQPDINIEKLEYITGEVFSSPENLSNTIRWIGIASANIDQLDYAASGGIHNGEALIKSLLAGASVAEICSTIYKNGNGQINIMLDTLQKWMSDKGYENISQFKGIMNAAEIRGGEMYERTQFLKYFGSKE